VTGDVVPQSTQVWLFLSSPSPRSIAIESTLLTIGPNPKDGRFAKQFSFYILLDERRSIL